MFGLSPAVRVFFAREPCDMRKSFDGLLALARDVMLQNVMSGHLFVFRSKSGKRLKVLYWDRTGLCVWYKRLERRQFFLPRLTEGTHIELTPTDLGLLLEGIDPESCEKIPTFELA